MKILVADDDTELTRLLCFTLAQSGFDVCSATDGRIALDAFERESPQLALLDVNMPGLDGFAVCAEIRRRSSIPIMMLSVRDEEDAIVTALDHGADDYVIKPFSPRALMARLNALIRRAEPREAAALTYNGLTLDLEEHTFAVGPAIKIQLTPLQLKALQLLMSSNGRTVTAERLMMHLWGETTKRERHTLKQLIHRLRERLEREAHAPNLLQTTPGAGYKLTAPDGQSYR